nr:hypothetical protein [Tanacetum cinerariifolium]
MKGLSCQNTKLQPITLKPNFPALWYYSPVTIPSPLLQDKPMSHHFNLTYKGQCHVGNPMKGHWWKKHGTRLKSCDHLTWAPRSLDGYDDVLSSLTQQTYMLKRLSEEAHNRKGPRA